MALVTLTAHVANTVLTAAALNNNFNAIVNQLNGNIEAANLANLAVSTAKIATGAVTGPKIAMGSDALGDLLYHNGTNYARLAGNTTTAKRFLTQTGDGSASAAPGWNAILFSDLPSGAVVKVTSTVTGATASGATAIPYDDSTPLTDSEGFNFSGLDTSHTPLATTHVLIIEGIFHVASSAVADVIAALRQDSTSAAIATGIETADIANTEIYQVKLYHKMTAGTTSAISFKIYIGTNGGATIYLNGNSGGRKMGGILFSSLTVTEVKA